MHLRTIRNCSRFVVADLWYTFIYLQRPMDSINHILLRCSVEFTPHKNVLGICQSPECEERILLLR
ncbi:hypothetical protein HBI39_065710 [Parastagonospora nodorum]|nr:hypothetical protein HBH42_036680 [Parastagonospora nodorum]KAH6129006.1 hypothetical protein HBI69_001640 [Parastagonospora nodorum]KAH6311629.1 hypothetical protein HBI39_065710 [Parastagonospora nodorum]